MSIKAKGLFAVASVMALALSACGGSGSGGSSADKSSGSSQSAGGSGAINLGVAYDTTAFDPSTTSSALAFGTNWQVMEGLYEFNMQTYKHYPALAADEPKKVSDTEYQVKLRDGAKFSDGKPVTSKDFLESYKRTTDPTSIYSMFFDFVDSVSAVDDNTIDFKLKYPFPGIADRLVDVKVIPASSTQEAMNSKPIGSGPYMYQSIDGTKELTAVPNPNYNGSYPAGAGSLKWTVLKDDSARLSAALGGTIDVMEAVPADAASQLEAQGWKIDKVEGYNNPFLMFNTTKAPFDKPEVRQAFLYAIDTQSLIKSQMAGEAKEATSFLPESNPMYKKAATQFTYDAQKAKDLLAKAGVSGLSVTLLTTDHPWIANLAPQIKQNLEAVGVTVNISTQASADLYANFTDTDPDNPKGRTYDIALAPGDPSVFGVDPGIIINWWYGDNVWTTTRDGWKNTDSADFKKLQDLMLNASQKTGDEAKDLYGQAQDLIAEQVPIYPLFHRTMITASNPKNVTDVTPIGATGLDVVGAKSTK
ncbi:MAG: ABC transporter substrate-binding protein [Actinomycetaceae bacterium]|nr:ABC transporter substrate-binding protein [Actinomycetaceae bacterium]MDY6082539.1 ABC transporter substrate-binding protein [Actinomycetaceae bacterium]